MTPTAGAVEREVKLEVDDRFIVPSLDADGSVVVEVLEPRHLDATYYDTADLRLLAAGITVRRRTGEGTRWTVKLPTAEVAAAGGLARREIDVVTDDPEPPAEVLDRIGPHLGGGGLVAVARLVSSRARLRLSTADGRPIGELDDDRVAVHDPRPGDPGSGDATGFREVEVEFGAEADPAAVGLVVDRLVAAGARRASGRSKVEHALDLLGRTAGGAGER